MLPHLLLNFFTELDIVFRSPDIEASNTKESQLVLKHTAP